MEWPTKINPIVLDTILDYKNVLQAYYHKVEVEIINTYNSITILYHNGIEDIYNEILVLKSLQLSKRDLKVRRKKRWFIPVCYESEFGLDLEEVSSNSGCSIHEIISMHTDPSYTVYFMGFMPGFMYLGGLNPRLHIARKDQPRLRVEKGAVGIAGAQTGIYPAASPGGWQIIGSCPVNLFDPSVKEPCFASSGDQVKFVQVSMEEYGAICERSYVPEFELL
ncbi:5-oxoprolinase subunit PxpB [Flavobacteriaceae bacterium F08102]|nr:5-oxoprolinase subunit PxpB [Flavobacteriaceae bacterium F08102]